MEIRKYKESDKEQILELLRQNTPKYFSPNEEQDLIYYLINHADNYFVIVVDGSIMGCGGFNLSEDKEVGKISWDIVSPKAQRHGYGSELTKFRIKKMKEIESVKTISVRTSQLVYKFYEKFGLELKEVVKDYWDKGYDLYWLDCKVEAIKI
jgi:ribosomal-protein-alanine N-acetyltransferase